MNHRTISFDFINERSTETVIADCLSNEKAKAIYEKEVQKEIQSDPPAKLFYFKPLDEHL